MMVSRLIYIFLVVVVLQCNAGVATDKMYEMLTSPPVKMMILGAGCSPESQATAQASHLWNLTQVAYASSSPALSNRARFPRFFRIVSSETQFNIARVQLMKIFGWKKVATIHESFELFSDGSWRIRLPFDNYSKANCSAARATDDDVFCDNITLSNIRDVFLTRGVMVGRNVTRVNVMGAIMTGCTIVGAHPVGDVCPFSCSD